MTDDEMQAEYERLRKEFPDSEGLAIEGEYLLDEWAAFQERATGYSMAPTLRMAFDAGWDARSKYIDPPSELTIGSGSAKVTYTTTAGSPERMPPL
jgi:hypothetical protein